MPLWLTRLRRWTKLPAQTRSEMAAGAADRPVTLAAIAGAHGIAGEVRLKLFAASVDSLRPHRNFLAGDRTLALVSVRDGGQGPIARFAEVTDRNAAEALRGTLLAVPRASLPDLPAGEFYWHDLIGLPVEADGSVVGTVVSVDNFGASDIIEIEKADGGRVMVPLVPAAVLDVGERVIVDAAWLL